MYSKPVSFLATGVAVCLIFSAMGRSQAIPAYTITTVAGNGTAGFSGDSGSGTAAQLNGPFSAARDSSGNVYIADQFNHRIRMLDPSGNITTIAGNGTAGYTGDGAAATSATLNDPQGVAVDSSGNIYIADTNNNAVRKISGGKITTIVGSPSGSAGYTGDGGQGTSAQVFHPSSLALDSSGNLYIADTSNEAIRKLTPAGVISTFAGQGGAGFGGDGGLASRAQFSNPSGLAFDSAGNLYVADTTNNRVRMIAPNGIITTVAGSSSSSGYAGDGGAPTKARLNSPKGVAVDSAGNLYIADTFNNRIRVVASYGAIYTVAGSGATSAGGDGGPAIDAGFRFPSGVVTSPSGSLLVVDNQNAVVRLLTPVSGVPVITPGGVQTAGAFGGAKAVAPGSWIEIYGSNFSSTSRTWAGGDFVGVNAPTSLDATRVMIGSQPAFIDYISGNQVNAQVPSAVGTGQQTVTVVNGGAVSAPLTVTVNSTQPGLYAPPSFNIGGKQYLAALFPDGVTYVLPPGSIDGIASRQAKPGDTIIVYGVGFGPVTPSTLTAGQVVQQSNSLSSPLQVFFGQTPATLSYSGLAPGAVGLYQFNVVVPDVVNSDAIAITFPVGGMNGNQTLYTAVHN